MAAKAKKAAKAEQPPEKIHGIGVRIKKGDRVMIIGGRDKGRKGEVLKVMNKEDRALVSGVNMMKRHQKQTARVQGGIVNREAPIHLSNIAHIDPKTGGPTRIGFKVLGDGRKVRFAKKSGEVIDV
ncbi:MAG TPA: 50S ribosomal protein L24 [Rhizomicrobium sp.]|jgi:large subunit ribosomal protein L24|nr:50S ribosomal protein L24 [Rhizomicrobium sp.]